MICRVASGSFSTASSAQAQEMHSTTARIIVAAFIQFTFMVSSPFIQ